MNSNSESQRDNAASPKELAEIASRYAVGITPNLRALINKDDPSDPIAAQFLPDKRELIIADNELADPTADEKHSPVRGIVHRHHDRVLFTLHHACLAYCRFCFRRTRVGPGNDVLSAEEIEKALSYIESHHEIWEVILTGGDPLALSTRKITDIMARLHALDNVRVIRLHTRVPIMSPQRITNNLVKGLRGKKAVFVVLHTNHVRELTPQARHACAKLIDAGIPMLSQSVLLRGVNDTIDALDSLMRALVETRIKPYYIHQLDPAPGTSHFLVSIDDGRALMADLWRNASGLCQPRYVVEQPDGGGKQVIG